MKEQCVSVSFVDDIDFVTEGTNYENQMKNIITIYNQLHTATGGQIEFGKTKYFAWK